MNILSILKGIENLATELLLWIVYIPKTLFKVIKDPFWVRKYVNAELEKEHKFTEYMSPIMLYLATSVILYVLNDMIGSTGKDDPMGKLQGFGLLFLALPLMVALIIEWFRRAPFSRALILRSLYIQCYFLSPLMLAIFAFALSESSFWNVEQGDDDWSWAIKEIPIFLLGLTAIWFIIIEVKFIASDLKINRYKSFGILIACFVLLSLGFNGYSFLNDRKIDYNKNGYSEYTNFKTEKDGEFRISVWNKHRKDTDIILGLSDQKKDQKSAMLVKINELRDNYYYGNPLLTQKSDVEDQLKALIYDSNDSLEMPKSIDDDHSKVLIDSSLRYPAIDSTRMIIKNDTLDKNGNQNRSPKKINLEIGQVVMNRLDSLRSVTFKAKKNQELYVVVVPLIEQFDSPEAEAEAEKIPDIAFNVYDENYNSVLEFGTKWINYVRILYIAMFSYAVLYGYRAFFIYRKRKKQSAREAAKESQENQQKN